MNVEVVSFTNERKEQCWALGNGMIHREQNLPAMVGSRIRESFIDRYGNLLDLFDREEHFFIFGIHFRAIVTPGRKVSYKDGSSTYSYEPAQKYIHVSSISPTIFLSENDQRPSSYLLAERALEMLVPDCSDNIITLAKAVEFCFPRTELCERTKTLAMNITTLRGLKEKGRHT